MCRAVGPGMKPGSRTNQECASYLAGRQFHRSQDKRNSRNNPVEEDDKRVGDA